MKCDNNHDDTSLTTFSLIVLESISKLENTYVTLVTCLCLLLWECLSSSTLNCNLILFLLGLCSNFAAMLCPGNFV